MAIQGDSKGFKAKPWNTNHWWLTTTVIYSKDNSHLCIQVLHLTSITPRNVKPSHSSPEKSSSEVAWLERKVKTKWEDKADQKLYIFLTTEILQCLMKNIYILNLSVSFLIYKLPKRYIQRYKRKYLRWLQGETRKLHKISEDKNLMESMHRRISHTMRNLAWCPKS